MKTIAPWPLVCLIFTLLSLIGTAPVQSAEDGVGTLLGEEIPHGFDPKTGKRIIPNQRCLKCHGDENEKTDTRDDGSIVNIYVEPKKIEDSVHGEQNCNSCHITITRVPHREAPEVIVGCVECHRQTWADYKDDPEGKHERLGVVVEQIDSFLDSVHSRPSSQDQSSTNATCYDCHDAHNIGTLGSHQRADHRLQNPEVCGACHEQELTDYRESDHGKAVLEKGDSESAVCSDCHTTHEIDSPKGDAVMLTITENCGSCHKEAQQTYRSSYHGQVNKLGYTNSAKCFDCHGGHKVLGVDDPTSSIHLDNRLETCNQCHEDAPEGFLGFHAHGNANDFDKYPFIWVTAKFMQLLIFGVLGFFWVHVILWFYREYQDRKAGKSSTLR